MKSTLLLLTILIGSFVKASTYYFSASIGDDSRTSIQAQNPLTPWKSLAKLNSFFQSLQPGDSILFKRGETFPGQINITRSGNNISYIIFSAYGNGNNPVITGLTTAGTWTNIGNGIWESSCTNCGINVNTLIINNSIKAMGRYPNSNAPNKGYLKFESHAGNTLITDNELTASPNWTGSEVVIRKNYWTLDRNFVTQHNGSTVTFISPTGHPLLDGYGYFFQKHIQTLDQPGEWYYDAMQKKMKIYFGSGGPGSDIINVGITDTLVNINGRNYLGFRDLVFEGADTTAFAILNASNINIQRCSFINSGIDAINARNSNGILIENSVFDFTNNNAIRITDCSNSIVRRNTIRNTGMMAGMGLSNNQMYEAIYTRGTANTIEYNEVINTGYSAITFSGNDAIVKNNFIDNYTMVLDDGGGIYSWGDYDKTGRVVTGNIILNGTGAPEGTDVTVGGNSSGIYLDDRSANVEITNNTVANANRAGVYLHNSHEITLRTNTLFNNSSQVSMVHDDLEPADPIRNVVMQDNIFFSKTDKQSVSNSASRLDDIASFGPYNSNYYARPIDPHGIIQTDHRNGSGEYVNLRHNLAGWKALYNNDANSLPCPVTILPYVVNNTIGANRCSNGSFVANINGVFCMSSPVNCATTWNSGGRLDGGALEIRSTGGVTNINTHVSIGSVQAGKNYRIKFSLLGSNLYQTVGVFVLKNGAPYNALSEKKYFSLSTSRSENEFIFSSATTESDVLLIFSVNNTQLPFWIDNIDVREANVTITNPDDHIRFEYNATNAPKSIILDAAYMDVKSIPYLNTVILAPYSSVVLLRVANLLPVHFIDINATKKTNYTEVSWTISNEQEIASYEIEKSIKGSPFKKIAVVSASNQSSIVNYKSNDSVLEEGDVCYRIKAIKKSVGNSYSPITCLRVSTRSRAIIYPNPVSNQLTIYLDSSATDHAAELSVFDSKGMVVRKTNAFLANGKIIIDISSLPAGVYIAQIKSGEQLSTEKFIKQL